MGFVCSCSLQTRTHHAEMVPIWQFQLLPLWAR
uniref:Uncharacterized protein n=1 Tax=Arundo donax TaxID=35708 RepID=A0A0A9A5V7_ARUDO